MKASKSFGLGLDFPVVGRFVSCVLERVCVPILGMILTGSLYISVLSITSVSSSLCVVCQ